MNRTKIEWVRNPDGSPGWTFNPITGCLNNCSYCYARKLANGRLKSRYLSNPNLPLHALPYLIKREDPFYPRFWEERLSEPIEHPTPMRPAKRKGIFACDMSDLFGIGIPEAWTEQVMTTIKLCPYHRFYLLTKQPQNLIKFSPFPENCWVGVTATDRSFFNMAASALAQIKATIRYISFEPLLNRIQMTAIPYLEALFKEGWLDWVIIGCQTKPLKVPKFEWVEEIVNCADEAGIAVFVKPPLSDIMNLHRQELPTYERSRVSSLLP